MWEFGVSADISIGVGDARGLTGGVGEHAARTQCPLACRVQRHLPPAAPSRVITTSASAKNQQLIRRGDVGMVSGQLVDCWKTADLGSNSLLRLGVMRCLTVLP